ncbi:MAG: hypothetical protein AAFY72_17460 [Cyanobacteria bacterium J06649_4]
MTYFTPSQSSAISVGKRFGAFAAAALLVAGATLPAAAKTKTQPVSDAVVSGAVESATGEITDFESIPTTARGLSEAEIQQIVEAVVAEETSDWSKSEKSMMKAVMALDVDDAYLMKMTELSTDELLSQVKSDQKLSGVKAVMSYDEAGAKNFLMASGLRLAARAGAEVFRAVGRDVIIDILRMSASHGYQMFSALRTGDMPRFRTLMTRAFPRSRTFARLTGVAASSFCNTTTFGFRQRACGAFANAAQRGYNRVRSQWRLVTLEQDRVAFVPFTEDVYQPASRWWVASETV